MLVGDMHGTGGEYTKILVGSIFFLVKRLLIAFPPKISPPLNGADSGRKR